MRARIHLLLRPRSPPAAAKLGKCRRHFPCNSPGPCDDSGAFARAQSPGSCSRFETQHSSWSRHRVLLSPCGHRQVTFREHLRTESGPPRNSAVVPSLLTAIRSDQSPRLPHSLASAVPSRVVPDPSDGRLAYGSSPVCGAAPEFGPARRSARRFLAGHAGFRCRVCRPRASRYRAVQGPERSGRRWVPQTRPRLPGDGRALGQRRVRYQRRVRCFPSGSSDICADQRRANPHGLCVCAPARGQRSTPPPFPFDQSLWHDPHWYIEDESLCWHNAPHGATGGLRLAVLHAWIWLETRTARSSPTIGRFLRAPRAARALSGTRSARLARSRSSRCDAVLRLASGKARIAMGVYRQQIVATLAKHQSLIAIVVEVAHPQIGDDCRR